MKNSDCLTMKAMTTAQGGRAAKRLLLLHDRIRKTQEALLKSPSMHTAMDLQWLQGERDRLKRQLIRLVHTQQ